VTHLLAWIGARGPWVLAASLVVGIAAPQLADLARPLLPLSVFCLLTIAMVRMDIARARGFVQRPLAVTLAAAWIMIAMPLIAAAIFLVYRPEPAIALALILMATAPPTVSSPAMSDLIHLDGTFSLAILLACTLVTPLFVPLLSEAILDISLDVSAAGLAWRLAALIGGSALAALAIRAIVKEDTVRSAHRTFDGLNVAVMILFAIAAMDGVGTALIETPLRVVFMTGAAFALSFALLALGGVVFWRTGAVPALTIGYANGNRNMALAVSALAASLPDDTWLFFALWQFPIFLTPLMLKSLMRRLVERARL